MTQGRLSLGTLLYGIEVYESLRAPSLYPPNIGFIDRLFSCQHWWGWENTLLELAKLGEWKEEDLCPDAK